MAAENLARGHQALRHTVKELLTRPTRFVAKRPKTASSNPRRRTLLARKLELSLLELAVRTRAEAEVQIRVEVLTQFKMQGITPLIWLPNRVL